MTWLYVLLAFGALIAVLMWQTSRRAKESVHRKAAEKNASISHKQAKEALDKPDHSELLETLDDGDF